MVLQGDARIVYDEIRTLAWLTHIDAVCKNNITSWTIHLLGKEMTPTDLLRIVLADRRLQVIEFRVLRSTE